MSLPAPRLTLIFSRAIFRAAPYLTERLEAFCKSGDSPEGMPPNYEGKRQ